MAAMKRVFALFLIYITTITTSYSYELIFPKKKESNVSSNYAFFLGKANNSESIVINNTRVYTAPNGAFAYSVKLKDGENRVLIRSNYSTQVYKYNKKVKPAENNINTAPTEFEQTLAIVKKDNTPLRSTPIDFGMNRISHLFKGTNLLVNAEIGDFYRVFLSKDKQAWIMKNDVELLKNNDSDVASFIGMDTKKYSNAQQQSISFTKKLPYVIEDVEKEILFRVYNPELSPTSFYTINIPKPEKYSYKVDLNDGMYDFKVSAIPEKIEELTVVIDPGHGGSEKGAIGALGDLEKDINLKIGLELEEILKSKGVNVVMTRECDGNVSLEDRVDIAKKNNANIFVSIHLNSIGDIEMNNHKNRGTSIYYYNNNSKNLAKILENTITKSAGTKKNGIHTASFAVIRPSEYVGVLVEAAYIVNPLDSMLYKKEDFAKNVAQGIANGILEFVSTK